VAGKSIIGVSFGQTGVTNEGLEELKELKNLQSLNLMGQENGEAKKDFDKMQGERGALGRPPNANEEKC